MTRAFNVVILAGDRGPDDPVASAAGAKRKALVPVAGRPMLAYALVHAARLASEGGRIFVLANSVQEIETGLWQWKAEPLQEITFREGADGPAGSLARLMSEEEITPAFILTGDHPLLSAAMVDQFRKTAEESSADLLVGFVPKSGFDTVFPDMSRTFIRLGREAYSGANLFALLSPRASKVVEFWTNVEKDRKKSLKLVRAFGWSNFFRVLLRILDLNAAMKRASLALGVEICGEVLADPAAAMDVDRPEHLLAVRRRLE